MQKNFFWEMYLFGLRQMRQHAMPLQFQLLFVCLSPRDLVLPEVKPLTLQLKKVYEMNGLKATEEHLYRECWGIKSACSFIKRKGRRGEIPQESWLNQYLCSSVCVCARVFFQVLYI